MNWNQLLGKWLSERTAIVLLWVAVLAVLGAGVFSEVQHWSFSLAKGVAVFAYVYVWSTLWKAVNRNEPQASVDWFFLLLLLSNLFSFLAEEGRYTSLGGLISLGLALFGLLGIWKSDVSLFRKKQQFCFLWVSDYGLLLLIGFFIDFLEEKTWLISMGSALQFICYIGAHIVMTQVLMLAHKGANDPLPPMDRLIEEIGSEDPTP